MTILVSYSEIALKSRFVRNHLEKSLAQDIVNLLRKNGYENPSTRRKYGRIYVDNVPNEAVDVVSKVFGVANTMPSTEIGSDFESVVEGIVEEAKRSLIEGNSFAVRPRVVGKREYSSRDISYEAGSRVLEALKDMKIRVDLDNPDITLYAEVRDNEGFIYCNIIRGVL